MKEKNHIETAYKKYLSSADRIIELNGDKYYRIINKDRIRITDNVVIICIPCELYNLISDRAVYDENGNLFTLGKPAFMSFRSQIPEWYTKTVTVSVDNIHDVGEIGDYLTAAKNRNDAAH